MTKKAPRWKSPSLTREECRVIVRYLEADLQAQVPGERVRGTAAGWRAVEKLNRALSGWTEGRP